MRITLTIRSTLAALLLLCSNSTYAAQADGLVVGESVLATVLNTEIRAVDVMPSEEKRQDMKEQAKDNYAEMLEYVARVNASNKIFELVLEDYAKERGITLDQTLVNKFIDKFKSQVSSETSSKPIEEIAVKQVMQFKQKKPCSKSLAVVLFFVSLTRKCLLMVTTNCSLAIVMWVNLT